MRVLLVGGSGQLGKEIQSRWLDDEIIAPAHADLDLASPAAISSNVEAFDPDVVVNCAAFHNVDVCENEPGQAFAINTLAVDALARACQDQDREFVTISTDYVFDGDAGRPYTEADSPHPISVYGASKFAGELLVDRLQAKAYVVRTCGVYGVHASKSKGTFVDRVIRQAYENQPIRAVHDVVASPTYAGHLADALRRLVSTRTYGLFHACNVGAVSWYDFATTALELAGIKYAIEPISAREWKAAARRPPYSALENTKLQALGITMPSWREGIADYLRSRPRA